MQTNEIDHGLLEQVAFCVIWAKIIPEEERVSTHVRVEAVKQVKARPEVILSLVKRLPLSATHEALKMRINRDRKVVHFILSQANPIATMTSAKPARSARMTCANGCMRASLCGP